MRDAVRGADGESPVENAGQESNTAAPTSLVLPFGPHESSAGMLVFHGHHNNDRNNASEQDYDKADLLKVWKVFVEEDGASNACP